MILLLTLEENVAGVGEDVESVEQEYPMQDSFEQGKLPLTCIYATIFEIATHQKKSGKIIKTLATYVWQDILPPLIMSK